MTNFYKIEDAINSFSKGEMIIVVDDENRENEGDFVIAADKITKDDITFMIKVGRGLLCMPITKNTSDRLELEKISSKYSSLHETAFTISVDAIKNCTTGISSSDRYNTIKTIVDKDSKPSDLARPGHMFPLIAKEGGVLRRAGHTEAAVDLAILSKCDPSAVLIEIVDEDGTMARLDRLIEISKQYNMPIISIADLIKYRRQHTKLVKLVSKIPFPNKFGNFDLHLFEDQIHKGNHLAIVKGNIDPESDTLVRVHSQCLTGDIFDSLRCDCGEQLDQSLQMIEEAGSGILVYLRQEGRGIGLKNKILAYQLQDKGLDTVEANEELGFPSDLREYGIGAQILRECGVKKMKILTNNPRKIVGLDGFGLEVVDRVPIEVESNCVNKKYMQTKRDKLGHLLIGK